MVATDVIGTAEVVAHGMTGTLVPPQDPRALAELLADPDLRQRYAEAGRRRYVESFTARRMTEDTLRVYRDVLAEAGAPAAAARRPDRASRAPHASVVTSGSSSAIGS